MKVDECFQFQTEFDVLHAHYLSERVDVIQIILSRCMCMAVKSRETCVEIQREIWTFRGNRMFHIFWLRSPTAVILAKNRAIDNSTLIT